MNIQKFEKTVLVEYKPLRNPQQEISRADYNMVKYLLTMPHHQGGSKMVQAIKFLREQHSLGLAEAKQIVEAIREYLQAFPSEAV